MGDRNFKASVRVNVKDDKKYYSMQIPKRVAERLRLKKGDKVKAKVDKW